VARLRAVLAELASYVGAKGTGKQKRMLMVIRRVAEDVCEELQETDQASLSAYFEQMGQVISWIGSGKYDNMSPVMREWISARADAIDPPAITAEVEELVAVPNGTDSGDGRADPAAG
jgi:hypothetical protein